MGNPRYKIHSKGFFMTKRVIIYLSLMLTVHSMQGVSYSTHQYLRVGYVASKVGMLLGGLTGGAGFIWAMVTTNNDINHDGTGSNSTAGNNSTTHGDLINSLGAVGAMFFGGVLFTASYKMHKYTARRLGLETVTPAQLETGLIQGPTDNLLGGRETTT
jgi:hypothetical protein